VNATKFDQVAAEIVPVEGISHDTGPRGDSSSEALAGLRAVFDPADTLTAGNASSVTDGASALLLMSQQRAESEGREVLAYIRAVEYGAIDIDDGLLMAPGQVVTRILKRTELSVDQIDLIEVHDTFAAQVLANVAAWEKG
jgi:acetyl-CoA acetyltransferase